MSSKIPLSLRKIAGHLVSPEAIKAMREWAKDCQWMESKDDGNSDFIDQMSDQEIIRGVENHYEGGLEQFLEDMNPI